MSYYGIYEGNKVSCRKASMKNNNVHLSSQHNIVAAGYHLNLPS